jgi:hypothetical protein
MKNFLAVLLLAWAVCGTARAAQSQPWYVGAGIAADSFNLHATDAERHLPFTDPFGNSLSQDQYRFDENTTGYQFFGGYKFNPYIAAELEYVNFGDVRRVGSFNIPPGTPISGVLDSTTKFQARGLGLSMVGIWPIDDTLDLFGQVGMMRWRIRAPYTLKLNGMMADSGTGTDWGNNLFFGIGGTYHWNHVGLRLQYQRYTFDHPFKATNDANADVVSLSMLYSF